MEWPWSEVRSEERGTTARAFAILLLVTAAHTLAETARDALFLARLSPSRLPWVYLGLAVLGGLLGVRKRGVTSSARLAGMIVVASVVTAGFAVALRGPSLALVYALYAWTGVCASVLTVELWVLLGRLHTATQAKRLYGLVGSGAVLGAVVGSATSRALAAAVGPAVMLFGAAALSIAAAPLALGLPNVPARAEDGRGGALRREIGRVWSDPYPKRLLALATAASVTLTLADYTFKSVVAATVPTDALARYLATVSLGLSTLSLVAQVGVARYVLRRLGLRTALLVLPVGLAAGGVWVATGGGLRAALGLKGADGALRYSVHRTAFELLTVPVPDVVRERVKPVVDLVGQRGGQALASLAILALAAAGAGGDQLGLVVAVGAVGWMAAVLAVHGPYLDLFRTTLRAGGISARAEVPQLDVGALETLLVGLSSDNDAEVSSALDLLAAEGKARVIPPLVLYHPSKAVVLRALEIFVEAGRRDFLPVADRLRDHADGEIAAAALRARALVDPDRSVLEARLRSGSPEVRAAAAVAMLARGSLPPAEARALLGDLAGTPAAAREVARGARHEASRGEPLAPGASDALDEALLALARSGDLETRREAARAIERRPSRRLLLALTEMLDEHSLRVPARAAIARVDGAAAFLDRALVDPALPLAVRIHVPRTLAQLPPGESVPILVRHLGDATLDGTIRFKIIRALARLRRDHPALPLDERALRPVIDDNLDRALALAEARGVLRGATRGGAARELLAELLFDKELYALDRICSLFALLEPTEDFVRIFRGVRSPSPRLRSSSRELLETVIRSPYRDRVLALVDDVLGEAAPPARVADFEPTLRALAADRDALVATLATYAAAEAGLDLAAAELERGRSAARATGLGEDVLEAPLSRRGAVVA